MRKPFHKNYKNRKGQFKRPNKNVRNVNRLIDTLHQMDITAQEIEEEYLQDDNEDDNEDIAVGRIEEIEDIYRMHNVTIDETNQEC